VLPFRLFCFSPFGEIFQICHADPSFSEFSYFLMSDCCLFGSLVQPLGRNFPDLPCKPKVLVNSLISWCCTVTFFVIFLLSFFSPLGEVFRARLRQFPALVNCCTIDWFSEWPAEALRSVALRFLNDIPDLDCSDAVLNGLVRMQWY
jgi:hypothetical protein